MEGFVGRQREAQVLKDLLEGASSRGLKIQSIEGPSGIGKSSVFAKALQAVDLDSLGYLKIELAGANRGVDGSSGDFTVAAIDQLVGSIVRSAAGPGIGLKPPSYYFPKTREAIEAVSRIRSEITKELSGRGISTEDFKGVADLIKTGASIVGRVGVFIPKIREFVDAQAVKDAADEIPLATEEIKALSAGSIHFWEKLGLGSASSLREAAKQDPEEVLASALVADLTAILVGTHEGKLQPGHGKIKRLERLLFVVEDYEALHKQLGSLLIPKLFNKLKNSDIDSTLIVLTRFRLKATNALWKDYEAQLRRAIVLKPLERAEVNELLTNLGIDDPQEHERAWHESSGLPYHLSLLIDEIDSGGRSSTSLKELHDRVVMWMRPCEIAWLHQVLYMDVMRVEALEQVFGSEQEAKEVRDWFESEGSILDQASCEPRMLPFVRSRLREYLEGRDRRKTKELKARADAVVLEE
ncbi:ATP-binding protein [Xanthomonas sp. MLO165]|uniref:ATP-binding protein n=1 Tax=Xanthomonas sp. MLO165 TaxID=2081477 RepID=UPI001C050C89|nr:ATP-binding protein [Xanthomonas sp. MLO165]